MNYKNNSGRSENMEQQKIGKFIHDLRKEKDLIQKQLADLVGVSDKTISKWETGVSQT